MYHARAHSEESKPVWLQEEPRPKKTDIEIDVTDYSLATILQPASRINFSRRFNVSFDVNLRTIERVAAASMKHLEQYVREAASRRPEADDTMPNGRKSTVRHSSTTQFA